VSNHTNNQKIKEKNMAKTNAGMNPPKGAPGSSNPRKGVEKKAAMYNGSNPATKQASGNPGSSNPRSGKVVMPSVYGPGGIQGQPKVSGNPGSSNPRKGSVTKTAMYTGGK
jgi:hypothetical protein